MAAISPKLADDRSTRECYVDIFRTLGATVIDNGQLLHVQAVAQLADHTETFVTIAKTNADVNHIHVALRRRIFPPDRWVSVSA